MSNLKWELALCPKDEEDIKDQEGNIIHPRKKYGDVMTYKSFPAEWGKEELKRYIFIIVDNITESEVKQLIEPHYESGLLEKDSGLSELKRRKNSIIFTEYNSVKNNLNENELKEHMINFISNNSELTEINNSIQNLNKIKEKKRFSISLDTLKIGWLPEFNENLAKDYNVNYQPFKENNIIIDMSEHVAICMDKNKKSCKYKNIKIKS